MYEPMEPAILHAKFLAKHLSRCNSRLVIRIALKEVGIPSYHDAFQYSLNSVKMLCENPHATLMNGVFMAVGLLRDPAAGENDVDRAIAFSKKIAWKNRNAQLWEYYFPEGCPGSHKCPTNRDFLMAFVDFVELWKGLCEEVNYESV